LGEKLALISSTLKLGDWRSFFATPRRIKAPQVSGFVGALIEEDKRPRGKTPGRMCGQSNHGAKPWSAPVEGFGTMVLMAAFHRQGRERLSATE
jgi:hypothetical protein